MAGKKDKIKEITGRLLTKKLRELAVDMVSISDDGKPVTRAEKLAMIMWDHALGYTEQTKNKTGSLIDIEHKPAPWAITLLMDRIEGKVANAADPGVDRPSLGQRLKETGAKRINKI